jgi:hypothetical protein
MAPGQAEPYLLEFLPQLDPLFLYEGAVTPRLRCRVAVKLLRRPRPPLRTIRGLARQGSAFSPRVHAVAVGPVLMHAPPGIAPVVEDLRAKQMTPDAASVPISRDRFLVFKPLLQLEIDGPSRRLRP